jgi:hypothetical protein
VILIPSRSGQRSDKVLDADDADAPLPPIGGDAEPEEVDDGEGSVDSGGDIVDDILLGDDPLPDLGDDIVPVHAGDAPVPAPLPPPHVVAPGEDDDDDSHRPTAIVSYMVPGTHGGKITYYPCGKRFEATCGNEAHGNCRIQRKATRAKGKLELFKPSQGRCVGFLVAWVVNNDHISHNVHLTYTPSHELRKEARELVASSAVGRMLLLGERCLNGTDHGNQEPVICP